MGIFFHFLKIVSFPVCYQNILVYVLFYVGILFYYINSLKSLENITSILSFGLTIRYILEKLKIVN